MFQNSDEWHGKTLDCLADDCDPNQMIAALSQASGVKCSYGLAVPVFAQKMFLTEMYNMVEFFKAAGYKGSIEEFKKVVPDAKNVKEFFDAKGQWGNGEKFTPKAAGEELDNPPSSCTIV